MQSPEFQNHHALTLWSTIREFRNQNELIDIHVKAGKKVFAAHRVVLAALCPYLQTTISQMTGNNALVEIDLPPEGLSACLDYLYTGDIFIIITKNNLLMLRETAEFLMLEEIARQCSKHLSLGTHLKNTNMMEVCSLFNSQSSQRLTHQRLRDKAMDLWQGILEFHDQSMLCDFSIKAEKQSIHAHKLVLAAMSPYLRIVLNEHKTMTSLVLNLPYSSVQFVIDYLYIGSVNLEFSKTSILEIKRSADLFMVQSLQKYCDLILEIPPSENNEVSPMMDVIFNSDGTRCRNSVLDIYSDKHSPSYNNQLVHDSKSVEFNSLQASSESDVQSTPLQTEYYSLTNSGNKTIVFDYVEDHAQQYCCSQCPFNCYGSPFMTEHIQTIHSGNSESVAIKTEVRDIKIEDEVAVKPSCIWGLKKAFDQSSFSGKPSFLQLSDFNYSSIECPLDIKDDNVKDVTNTTKETDGLSPEIRNYVNFENIIIKEEKSINCSQDRHEFVKSQDFTIRHVTSNIALNATLHENSFNLSNSLDTVMKERQNGRLNEEVGIIKINNSKACESSNQQNLDKFNFKEVRADSLDSFLNLKAYSCSLCQLILKKEGEIIRHISNLHDVAINDTIHPIYFSPNGEFICEVCCEIYKSLKMLWIHKKSNHQTIPLLNCSLCDWFPQNVYFLQLHRIFYHNIKEKNGSYFCTWCDKNFDESILLKVHSLCHCSNERYSCERCPFQAESDTILSQHSEIHHHVSSASPLKSDAFIEPNIYDDKYQKNHVEYFNNLPFVKMPSLFINTEYKTTDVIPDQNKNVSCGQNNYQQKCSPTCLSIVKNKVAFFCDMCSVKTETLEELQNHMASEHEKSVINCPECTYCTFKKSNFQMHFHRMHVLSGKTLISRKRCPLCKYKTPYFFSLKMHMRLKHPTFNFSLEFSSHSRWKFSTTSEKQAPVENLSTLSISNNLMTNQPVDAAVDSGRLFFCQHCKFTSLDQFTINSHMDGHHQYLLRDTLASIGSKEETIKSLESSTLTNSKYVFTKFPNAISELQSEKFECMLDKKQEIQSEKIEYTLDKTQEIQSEKIEYTLDKTQEIQSEKIEYMLDKKEIHLEKIESILDKTQEIQSKKIEYTLDKTQEIQSEKIEYMLDKKQIHSEKIEYTLDKTQEIQSKKIEYMLDKKEIQSQKIEYILNKKQTIKNWKKLKKKKIFKCYQCLFSTFYPQNLKRHIKGHYRPKNIKCFYCPYLPKSFQNLYRHVRMEHVDKMSDFETNIDISFPCSKCKAVFKKKTDLEEHIKVFHPAAGKVFCNLCKFITVNSYYLNFHKFVKHNIPIPDNPTVHCPLCYQKFSTTTLQKHNIACHTIVPGSLACDICNSKFITSLALEKHLQTQNSYSCQKCYFKTHNKSRFSLHIFLMHNNHLNCPVCSCSVKSNRVFRLHMKNKHPSHEYLVNDIIQRNSLLKWKCPFCQHQTPTSVLLQRHIHYYHPKSVNYPSIVKKHSLFARKWIKWKKCLFCHYNSNVVISLQRHLRKEHREKILEVKYGCSYCDYSSVSVFQMKEHLKQNHSEQTISAKIIFLMTKQSNFLSISTVDNMSNKTDPIVTPSLTIPPSIDIHMPITFVRGFICPWCGFNLTIHKSVKQHIWDKHKNKPVSQLKKIMNHEFKIIYTPFQQLLCDICGSAFSHTNTLAYHIESCKSKFHWCKPCNFSCESFLSMLQHAEKEHSSLVQSYNKQGDSVLDDIREIPSIKQSSQIDIANPANIVTYDNASLSVTHSRQSSKSEMLSEINSKEIEKPVEKIIAIESVLSILQHTDKNHPSQIQNKQENIILDVNIKKVVPIKLCSQMNSKNSTDTMNIDPVLLSAAQPIQSSSEVLDESSSKKAFQLVSSAINSKAISNNAETIGTQFSPIPQIIFIQPKPSDGPPLTNKLRSKVWKEQKFKCTICAFSTTLKTHFDYHMKKQHSPKLLTKKFKVDTPKIIKKDKKILPKTVVPEDPFSSQSLINYYPQIDNQILLRNNSDEQTKSNQSHNQITHFDAEFSQISEPEIAESNLESIVTVDPFDPYQTENTKEEISQLEIMPKQGVIKSKQIPVNETEPTIFYDLNIVKHEDLDTSFDFHDPSISSTMKTNYGIENSDGMTKMVNTDFDINTQQPIVNSVSLNSMINNESNLVDGSNASFSKNNVEPKGQESPFTIKVLINHYGCICCTFNTTNLQILSEHILYDHNMMKDNGNPRNYMFKTVITKDRNFQCHLCALIVKSRLELVLHIQLSHGKILSCEMCDFSTDNQKLLEKHLNYKHVDLVGKKSLKCAHCTFYCFNEISMQNHLKIHLGDQFRICRFCEQFINKQIYGKHIEECSMKPYKCMTCSFVTDRELLYQAHMNFQHKGELNLKCPLCEYICEHDFSLTDHLCLNHPEKWNANIDSLSNNSVCKSNDTSKITPDQEDKLFLSQLSFGSSKKQKFKCPYCDHFRTSLEVHYIYHLKRQHGVIILEGM